MKKLGLTFLAVLSAIILVSQPPQAFKYQAVARDNAGNILINQDISFQISILQGSTTGTAIYVETHDTITNDFGLVNLEIGNGAIVSGDFTTINWGHDSYFLKVEMDETGMANYQLMGSSQLLGVPYSINSLSSNSLILTSPNGTNYTVRVDDGGNLTTQFACGSPFVDTRDGQAYNTVQIGNQCWMAENLKYLPSVYPPSSSSWTTPYYYVHGYTGSNVVEAKATENYQNYGVLYNQPASFSACPSGWHLPSSSEVNQLTDLLGGLSVAGGKMKSTRTEPEPEPSWSSPNTGATNESGFTGLPGSAKFYNDWSFPVIGYEGFWWTSTYAYENNWDSFVIQNIVTNVFIITHGGSQGLSVRCIKD